MLPPPPSLPMPMPMQLAPLSWQNSFKLAGSNELAPAQPLRPAAAAAANCGPRELKQTKQQQQQQHITNLESPLIQTNNYRRLESPATNNNNNDNNDIDNKTKTIDRLPAQTKSTTIDLIANLWAADWPPGCEFAPSPPSPPPSPSPPLLAEQCGYPKRVRSLVDDAKFDTIKNRQLAEERFWLNSADAASNNNAGDASASVALLLGCSSSSIGSLDSDASSEEAAAAATAAAAITTAADSRPAGLFCDFPRHISQLDQCNHLLIKYEPELDPTHPGFHDLEYRARRKEVAQLAFDYKHGQPIPRVDYNQKELDTWRYIYIRLKEAYSKWACRQHNLAIEQLERECGYSADSIPQLQRVSEFLERRTGWRLRPAAGLLSARDFLASLAFRVFQTTQYIRHWGNPEHSVEPDCIHELMGHIPMLCDPSFAHFSQEIGLASLGASDEQIEKFATLYWFTVEFGLCREDASDTKQPQQLKCYGAGLLSSFGEMEHALESGKPQLKEFKPEETAVESYDDAEYQVTYYVAESFDDAKAKIKQFAARHLRRDFELAYDPYSCSIRVLDNFERLDSYAESIKNDLMHLSAAIGKLKLKQHRQQQQQQQQLDHDHNQEQPAPQQTKTKG